MQHILITGATGYIGKQVVTQLALSNTGCQILTLNRDVQKAKQTLPFPQCEHTTTNDAEAIRRFAPDVVLHLAAFSTPLHNEEVLKQLIDTNIHYGAWLLEQLNRIEGKNITFVNTGSFAEYRLGTKEGCRPAYLYTATKTAFKAVLRFYQDLCKLRVITAIPYSVYGGQNTRKQLMDYLLDSLNSTTPIDMTPGEQILDFVHVDDVARFYVNIALHPEALPEGEYHLGTGKGTSIRALADLAEQLSGKKANINWGGREYRPLDVMNAIAPHNKELDKFWKPQISLRQGLNLLLQNN